VTLLSFSFNVLFGIELFLGRPLPDQDKQAYLHLWRYIGFLIGVRDENNPCKKESEEYAKIQLESLLLHLLNPSDDSRALVNNMLKATSTPLMSYTSRALTLRLMLGEDWADSLALPKYQDASCLQRAWVMMCFWMVSWYTWVSNLPVLSFVILKIHTAVLRWAIMKIPEFSFPLQHPPVGSLDELACPGLLKRAKKR